MALTHRDNVYSPPLSLSGSSFSMLTSPPSSDDPFEAIDESSSDEDEIVWTANELDPDEDFILIPQPDPRAKPVAPNDSEEDALLPHEALSRLSLEDHPSVTSTPTTAPARLANIINPTTLKSKQSFHHKGRRSAGARSEVSGQTLASTSPKSHRGRKRRGRKDASTSYPSPSPSPERDLADHIFPVHLADGKGAPRFGECPLVEESDPIFTKYEDAVSFITSFLSNPSAALTCSPYTRLTFLQSLIIELGLMSPSAVLPSSMKSATHFLKTRAFINIGEYLSVREQGLDKLKQIMFNSRRELASDLRRKKGGKKTNKGWVKRHGLNVLLVTIF